MAWLMGTCAFFSVFLMIVSPSCIDLDVKLKDRAFYECKCVFYCLCEEDMPGGPRKLAERDKRKIEEFPKRKIPRQSFFFLFFYLFARVLCFFFQIYSIMKVLYVGMGSSRGWRGCVCVRWVGVSRV